MVTSVIYEYERQLTLLKGQRIVGYVLTFKPFTPVVREGKINKKSKVCKIEEDYICNIKSVQSKANNPNFLTKINPKGLKIHKIKSVIHYDILNYMACEFAQNKLTTQREKKMRLLMRWLEILY